MPRPIADFPCATCGTLVNRTIHNVKHPERLLQHTSTQESTPFPYDNTAIPQRQCSIATMQDSTLPACQGTTSCDWALVS